MNYSLNKVRALGLCSGGLDSILSALVLKKQGIEVEWITFETPFFSSANAGKAAKTHDIPLTVKPITPIYIKMLKAPPCGYGKNMNPCLDCHTLMFKIAGQVMREKKFDFLFSGEVLGQRPMSQKAPSLRYVEKNSGFDGFIVRPLSAKLLPSTIPEQKGLLDRELLLGFSGRSRKPQIKLAEEFNVIEYPAPAGGCLLTDKGFSNRLKDLFQHHDDYTEAQLHLLKFGRHFRLNPDVKLIVGRALKDNESILSFHDPEQEPLIEVKDYPGPVAILQGITSENSLTLAASICAGYSKAPLDKPVDVTIQKPGSSNAFINVLPLPPSTVKKLMI